jgi:hypothetical protein
VFVLFLCRVRGCKRCAKLLQGKRKLMQGSSGAAGVCSKFSAKNCGAGGGGAAASAVPASTGVYGRSNLAKKDKGAALVLTKCSRWPGLQRRVVGNEVRRWSSGLHSRSGLSGGPPGSGSPRAGAAMCY